MRPKKFDEEFKSQAVRLVKEGGRSASAVSREIGVSQTALSRWLRASRGVARKTKTVSPMEEENARLRKEVRQLRMERDFLRDAAAYFAKLKKSGSSL